MVVNCVMSLLSMRNVGLVRSEIVVNAVEAAVLIELLARDVLLVAVTVTLVFRISGSVRRQ